MLKLLKRWLGITNLEEQLTDAKMDIFVQSKLIEVFAEYSKSIGNRLKLVEVDIVKTPKQTKKKKSK